MSIKRYIGDDGALLRYEVMNEMKQRKTRTQRDHIINELKDIATRTVIVLLGMSVLLVTILTSTK
jgi:hypothetical protein